MIASDLVKSALRMINSYQPGETIADYDANDVLDVLNRMVESWTIDHNINFGSKEYILQWVSGQASYTIGNPFNDELGEPNFTGTLTGSSNVITGVTNIPSDLKAGVRVLGSSAGSTIIDSANVLPADTYVTAIGATTITLSEAATATPSSNPVSFRYSIPGDFGIPRPLRIQPSFTRFNTLDFSMNVALTQEQYQAILYKPQPGPWPVVGWYNNLYPYGVLSVYQTPGNGADFHMFTDNILSDMELSTPIILPQGYSRALINNLAREISPMYGKPITPDIKRLADESLSLVKALNAKPTPRARYDSVLLRGNRNDAGFVFSGGYNQ